MTATGQAMRMKIDLSRYKRTPAPFTPPPLLPPVDHDLFIEGYAAPAAVVDREWMRFANYCWSPIPKAVPLLLKHDPNHPAGEILEAYTDDLGLYIKARVTDPEAKRCNFFSIAATIHSYRIQHADDPVRAHALIIHAVLDEVTITNTPANPAAKILFRYRPPPALEAYDSTRQSFLRAMKAVEDLQAIIRARPIKNDNVINDPAPKPRHPNAQFRPHLRDGDNRTIKPTPVEPHRATPFGALVSAIERNHHAR